MVSLKYNSSYFLIVYFLFKTKIIILTLIDHPDRKKNYRTQKKTIRSQDHTVEKTNNLAEFEKADFKNLSGKTIGKNDVLMEETKNSSGMDRNSYGLVKKESHKFSDDKGGQVSIFC